MSVYFNQKYYKKSYLLEFRNSADINAIAFSLPPQSEDFSFPQRIGETKTFGGSVIEDYGNDTSKITISGTTVNSEIRIIYKGGKGIDLLTGEGEVFAIKKLIENYGKQTNLGKKVYLYSLDQNLLENNKYWRVAINSFDIKRSKENPLAYTYTLSCTGIPEQKKRKDVFAWLDDFEQKIDEAVEAITKGIPFLEEGLAYSRVGLDLIEVLKDGVDKFEGALSSYVGVINNYIEVATDYHKETLALGNTIIKSAQRLTLGAATSLNQSAFELHTAAKELADFFSAIKENEISSDFVAAYNMTAQDIKNTWNIQSREIEDEADFICAETKIQGNTLDYTIVPGDIGKDDEIVRVYGFVTVKTTDSDTWDSLSQKYYGDSSHGIAMAIYNGNTIDNELESGTKVKIPILARKEANDGSNKVYSTSEQKDNYGLDISIENGDFGVLNGDFKTIADTDNLDQAIASRLQTTLDSRVRLNVYGIRSSVGSVSDAENYLLTSIYNTVLEDPRVKSIESLKYSGMGDHVQVKIDYTDINNQNQTFGGFI